ncbi:KxYKxGKxW signal peptide domain-containing protein [Furfurilactobacillus rossiae]|uniref:Uncharacterized protein n=1 Tax=Furfurilactobacillus rossiae DSM 15814 TaxID=1114972 RepID=A0A0R1RFB5_9LACO|nr:KxYKxGKxW signal peptide domain-containing protein [Furfurilactobacillus rossiae]KRL52901.1 hypothetical protein FD35_GL001797 [Furfurilactobacillus rossiae DSM 15814]QFR65616.1 hypothetical protein LR814_00110 [Furfurilactobacillus rossiae]QFR68010.1 hypothetical protein LR814_13300 [Furfurilactobacillus rossiae]QLE61004.1 cell surface protein precursor GY [Furfurilactobacillus rossiae]
MKNKQYKHASSDKTFYKMYKSGKNWVIGSVVALGASSMLINTVHADTVNDDGNAIKVDTVTQGDTNSPVNATSAALHETSHTAPSETSSTQSASSVSSSASSLPDSSETKNSAVSLQASQVVTESTASATTSNAASLSADNTTSASVKQDSASVDSATATNPATAQSKFRIDAAFAPAASTDPAVVKPTITIQAPNTINDYTTQQSVVVQVAVNDVNHELVNGRMQITLDHAVLMNNPTGERHYINGAGGPDDYDLATVATNKVYVKFNRPISSGTVISINLPVLAAQSARHDTPIKVEAVMTGQTDTGQSFSSDSGQKIIQYVGQDATTHDAKVNDTNGLWLGLPANGMDVSVEPNSDINWGAPAMLKQADGSYLNNGGTVVWVLNENSQVYLKDAHLKMTFENPKMLDYYVWSTYRDARIGHNLPGMSPEFSEGWVITRSNNTVDVDFGELTANAISSLNFQLFYRFPENVSASDLGKLTMLSGMKMINW